MALFPVRPCSEEKEVGRQHVYEKSPTEPSASALGGLPFCWGLIEKRRVPFVSATLF